MKKIACSAMMAMAWVVPGFCDQTGIDVAEGLTIRQVADDDLVPDCTCVAVDAKGRVVASGPGYIRLLIDQDSDGHFDDFKELVKGPGHGADGLYFDDSKLYYVGDNGVWKVSDSDGDEVVDSSPTKVLDIKTGGEHDAHALRKGPDGHWYLIAGNGTKGMFDLQNVTSPAIPNPRAGAIWRISPDWKTREVWAHGFRNAYDFDFAPGNAIDTFDSDGERDVSLPWYRPTRVFRVRRGDDAGWISRSWKRPNSDPQMPMVLAELGRGSPTGVLRYRHQRLPKRFRNGVVVLDWTFGRIVFVSDDANSDVMAQPSGTTGFAVTDIDAFPDGRLVVSVGGRRSRGGLYLIDAAEPNDTPPTNESLWAHQPEVVLTKDALRRLRDFNDPKIDQSAAKSGLKMLQSSNETEKFAGIALLIESVGGLGPGDPKDARGKEQIAAVFDGYRGRIRPQLKPFTIEKAEQLLLTIVNSSVASEELKDEAIRALAVLETGAWYPIYQDLLRVESPIRKLHRLIAIARMPGSYNDDTTDLIAEIMLDLPIQYAESDLKIDSNWTPRLGELFVALRRRNSLLPSRIVSHPNFGHPAHLVWTEQMEPESLERARIKFLSRFQDEKIDPAVARFIALGNDAIRRGIVRRWLEDPITRSAAWLAIARHPKESDVPELQKAAMSVDKTVRERAEKALQRLGVELPQRQSDSESVQKWLAISGAILARKGNAENGQKLFTVRQCANCHNGGKALGPSLEGISKRFSGEDILRATVDPDHTIADRYRAKQVVTADGHVLIGMKIYESVDGLTLLTAEAKTLRINQEDIAASKDATKSLMPAGLLDGLSNDDVADLLAYMQSL